MSIYKIVGFRLKLKSFKINYPFLLFSFSFFLRFFAPKKLSKRAKKHTRNKNITKKSKTTKTILDLVVMYIEYIVRYTVVIFFSMKFLSVASRLNRKP